MTQCDQTGLPVPRKDGGWHWPLTPIGPFSWSVGVRCPDDATHRLTRPPTVEADNGQERVYHACDDCYRSNARSWGEAGGWTHTELEAAARWEQASLFAEALS